MKFSKVMMIFLGALICMTGAGRAADEKETGWTAQGLVQEGLYFKSSILGRDVNYALYQPPDYDNSTRRYPVVYLLHGYTDDESAWIQFGEVNLAADRAIAAREIPPMIIVMPDAKVTWYINDYQNKTRYEDMIVQEFIPFIDATYRTRAKKEFRGISDLSMGGWGSLLFAMRHPDLFAACAAFSSAIWTDDEILALADERYEQLFAELFGHQLKGQDRLNAHFCQYHSLDLAKTLPADSLKKVRFYIDCGDDDFLIKGNMALCTMLCASATSRTNFASAMELIIGLIGERALQPD